MVKTVTKVAQKHRHAYEMTLLHTDDAENWRGTFCWYMDGEAMITITCAHPNLFDCVGTAHAAMHRAQLDLRNEHLLLPDMGDFQIYYHPAYNKPID